MSQFSPHHNNITTTIQQFKVVVVLSWCRGTVVVRIELGEGWQLWATLFPHSSIFNHVETRELVRAYDVTRRTTLVFIARLMARKDLHSSRINTTLLVFLRTRSVVKYVYWPRKPRHEYSMCVTRMSWHDVGVVQKTYPTDIMCKCILLSQKQANSKRQKERGNLFAKKHTGWRKKTGPAYLIANILKTPWPNCVEIGELLQYYMLNTVINFFCLKISSRCGAT